MRQRHIIILAGRIGCGKDTAADYLVRRHHFIKMSFAESLKDVCCAIFGWDRALIEGSTSDSREWREMVDTWWANRLGIPQFTPRWAMQHIGTDALRNHFHDDIWIASLQRKIMNINKSIVITDCRFPNEMAAIQELGGVTVRLNRGQYPAWLELARTDLPKFLELYPNVYPSEYSSVNLEYDHYIDNNGDYEELHAQIRAIINSRR
jgi:hypothetical protein